MGRAYSTQVRPFENLQEQMVFVDQVIDSISDDIEILKADLDTFKETINHLIIETMVSINAEEAARFVADESLQSQIKALETRIQKIEP